MAEDVGSLGVSLSLDASDFNRPLQSVDRNLKALGGELSTIRNKGKEWGDSVEGLEAKQEVLGRTLSTQETKVRSLREAYEQSVREKGADAAATEQLAVRLNRAVAEYTRTETEINQVNDTLRQQREELERSENSWNQFADQASTAGEKLNDAGEKMKGVGEGLTLGVTTPIVSAGIAAVLMADEFDSAGERIQSGLGLTAKEAEGLEASAESLWKNGFSGNVSDAADAIVTVKKNLNELPSDQLEKITGFAGILADRFEIDLAQSTNTAGMVMKAFGGTAEEAFDLMTYGLQHAKGDGGELLDVFNEYAPQFSALGYSAEGFMATLIEGSQSGAFNMDLLGDAAKESFLLIGEGSDDVKDKLKEMGLDSEQIIDGINSGGEDAQKSFMAVSAAISGIKDPTEKTAAAIALFGTPIEDLGPQFQGFFSDVKQDLEGVEGSTQKAGDALYDNFGAKATGIWREFQTSILPVGEQLLDLAEDALPKLAVAAGEVTDFMTGLEPETIKVGIAIAGIAAAAGPVLIVAGHLAVGLGAITTAAGTLATGIAGASGLGAGIAAFATGPVGIAIGAVAGLSLGIYALNEASKSNIDETQKAIEKRGEEIAATDVMIGRFEALQTANSLSTDEVLRYMDIMSELKEAKSEESIQKLSDEQSKLLEKSGLTNEEMVEFLELNGQIVEAAPATAVAISDQGNAYASVLEEVKALNQAERERLTQDTYMALTEEMDAQKANLEQQAELQDTIAAKEAERNVVLGERSTLSQEIMDKDLLIAGIKNEMIGKTHEETTILAEKLQQEEEAKALLEGQVANRDKDIEKIETTIGKKQKSLDETNKELDAYDLLLEDYAAMVLYEQGIVSEKGKANEAIKREQQELDKAKSKLKQLWEQGKINKSSYDEQNASLQTQQGKIDTAKEKLRQMNEVAGRTVYKDVNITENPKGFASTLDASLRRTVSKTVSIKYNNTNGPQQVGGFATGTRNAPGGLSWVGEEGPELMYIPQGSKVIPNKDSETLLNKWNIPTETKSSGKSNQFSVSSQAPNINISTMIVREEADIEKMAKALHTHIKQAERGVFG